MEQMKNFQPMLDEIFEELEKSSQFVIECKTVAPGKVYAWPPRMETISVNGSASLQEYQIKLTMLFRDTINRFLENFMKVDSDNRPLFFRETIIRALEIIIDAHERIDIDEVDRDFPGQSSQIVNFRDVTCLLDGEESTDPLLVLMELVETKDYARAWYILIEAFEALLACTCCMALPNHPCVPTCSMPGNTQHDSWNCPMRFVAALNMFCKEDGVCASGLLRPSASQ